jgi:hypothetical protein
MIIRLHTNLPNPVTEKTMIPFELSNECEVRLSLHRADGEEVVLITEERFGKGEHVVAFDATGIPTGSYFYRLSVDGISRAHTLEVVNRSDASDSE